MAGPLASRWGNRRRRLWPCNRGAGSTSPKNRGFPRVCRWAYFPARLLL